MISVKLGILLALPLQPPNREKPKLKKGKKKRNNKKKLKKSKSSAKSKKSNKQPTTKPDYMYDVGKPAGYFHIEYCLFPNKPTYNIDVVHWNTISKIFTKDGNVIYKNYVNSTTIFIPIMLQHKIDKLSVEELHKLHSYSFDILISSNKSKLSTSAKNEKTKVFYINESESSKVGFVQAFEQDPNGVNNFLDISIVPLITTKELMTSSIYTFDYDFLYIKILKLIKRTHEGLELFSKEYIPNAPPADIAQKYIDPDDANNKSWKSQQTKPKSKKEKKKVKKVKKEKKKKKKGKTSTDAKIKISAESYFTDPNYFLYVLKEPTNILEKAFVVISIGNLMSDESNIRMQPFTIKLKMIKNLPVIELLNQRFTAIQLRYNVPYVAKTTTLEKPLSERVIINESHVFFNIDRERLIEFLQTQRLCIELVGIRKAEPIKPSMFGMEGNDYKINSKIDPDTILDEVQTTVILAVACFDLALLLKPVHIIEVANSFRHPDNLLCQSADSMQDYFKFTNTLTTNEINLKTQKKHPVSQLWDGILIKYATSMMIQVNINTPIFGLTKMLSVPSYFKRMHLIVYKPEVAIVLLNEILTHNQFYTHDVLVTNYLLYGKRKGDEDMVTGFFIDNIDSFIFFIEGRADNFCRELIWSQVQNLNEPVCKIFYNSDYLFSQRIYKNFLSAGGLFKIVLRSPLQDIFKIGFVFLQQYVPRPCLQALRKLEILMSTPTTKKANQYCLFPTSQELLSLNIEFGVAFRIK